MYDSLSWNGVVDIPEQLKREKGNIDKVGLPTIYGGKAPWVIKNRTITAPYQVFPADGFYDPAEVYITGIPSIVQPKVTVRVLLEDALGQ